MGLQQKWLIDPYLRSNEPFSGQRQAHQRHQFRPLLEPPLKMTRIPFVLMGLHRKWPIEAYLR